MGRHAPARMVALFAVAFALTRSARAEPPQAASDALPAAPGVGQPITAYIEVERRPGSEVCPDAAAVFRSMERLFPERVFRRSAEATSAAASARVVIRELETGHEAQLSVQAPHPGERVILEKDGDCRGLADALALAFVLLVEPPDGAPPPTTGNDSPPANPPAISTSPNSSAPSPLPPAPPSPKEPPRAEPLRGAAPESPTEPDRGTARSRRAFDGSVAASAVGGLGLLSEPAGGAALGFGLLHPSGWGFSFQGLRLWSPPAKAEGGSVTLTAWAVLFGPCYERRLGHAFRLEACIRVGIGSQHANVEGFLSPDSGSYPWTVLVPTLGGRLGASKVAVGFVRIGPVGQLRAQSFSAQSSDGSGQTVPIAEAPNVGVMAELGFQTGGAIF